MLSWIVDSIHVRPPSGERRTLRYDVVVGIESCTLAANATPFGLIAHDGSTLAGTERVCRHDLPPSLDTKNAFAVVSPRWMIAPAIRRRASRGSVQTTVS